MGGFPVSGLAFCPGPLLIPVQCCYFRAGEREMASYYQDILDAIRSEVQPWIGQGRVADYIPALGRIRPDKFGIALATVDGQEAAAGDADERFSIQSISKVFTL